MANPFYTNTIDLVAFTKARAGDVEANFSAVEAGFDAVNVALAAFLASPAFSGIPTTPTPSGATPLQVANVAYVTAAVVAATIPGGLDSQIIARVSGVSAWAYPLLWTIKTGNYTAVSGDALTCNTTASAFTITLPATPIAGQYVLIADYAGTFATNNLTVGRNGSNIMGLAEDMTISTNNASPRFTYIDSTQGWKAT